MLSLRYHINDIEIWHDRAEYTLLIMFGDLGGVIEVLLIMGGFIVSSYADFNFVIRAL